VGGPETPQGIVVVPCSGKSTESGKNPTPPLPHVSPQSGGVGFLPDSVLLARAPWSEQPWRLLLCGVLMAAVVR
jgi:hypothetical protein